jgi:hypothetical protein
MAVFPSVSLASAIVILAQLNGAQETAFLSPEQDIVLPASGSASEPLKWLGANSPYFTGGCSIWRIGMVKTDENRTQYIRHQQCGPRQLYC